MTTIDGKTMLLGLIGWPVSHSLSPALHNAAATHHHLNVAYVPLPVHPDHLAAALRGLPALGFRGVNVTIPHKQAVMSYLDELDAAAQAIGAVNTVVISEQLAVSSGQSTVSSSRFQVSGSQHSALSPQSSVLTPPSSLLSGTNTDWSGFLADLLDLGFDPAGRECLVLGAGGSARAVVYGLGMSRGRVHLWARRQAQAEQVIHALTPHLPNGAMNVVSDLPSWLARHQPALIVNTTPLGMTPHVAASPWPDGLPFPPDVLVYDLVYNPPQTKLMRDAAAAGCRTSNGLGMLIHQGLQAFQLWTGVEVDAERVGKKWLGNDG